MPPQFAAGASFSPSRPMLDLNALTLPDLFDALSRDGRVDRLLELARDEDLDVGGDVTSRSVFEEGDTGAGRVVARSGGTVSGLELFPRLLRTYGANVAIHPLVRDGTDVPAGAVLATMKGPLRDILAIERPLLNLLGRLSGIATLTRRYVRALAGSHAVICDTRKTTPGLRALEKYAVRCGGGTLHRIGLFDAALFKDNHLAPISDGDLARRVADAARRARAAGRLRFVEVEVTRLEQLEAILSIERGLVDIVLLDNMPPDAMRRAVKRRDAVAPHVLLEASGGVTLETVRAIADTGVDRVSVGALTHSAPALDVALDLDEEATP